MVSPRARRLGIAARRRLASTALPLTFAAAALGAPAWGSTPNAPASGSTPNAPAVRPASAPSSSAHGGAPPGAPAPKPYDLGADLAARRTSGEADLGRGSTSAVAGEVFALVGAPHDGGRFASSRALTESALVALYNGRFAAHPARAVSVLLFWDAKTYGDFCRARLHEPCISPFGFFEPDERRIIMNAGPGLGTLTHEIVHPLVRADFPRAPTWLDEGLASLFEAPRIAGKEIHGGKNWRHPRLLAALRSKAERPKATLAALFHLSDDDFRDDDEGLHYATARYFCQWMDGRGLLWRFYHAYRDGFDADRTGERSFKEVTGTTLDEADGAFVTWVERL